MKDPDLSRKRAQRRLRTHLRLTRFIREVWQTQDWTWDWDNPYTNRALGSEEWRRIRSEQNQLPMEVQKHTCEQWARRHRDHAAACSCEMCGNRREWAGPTRQEVHADDDLDVWRQAG